MNRFIIDGRYGDLLKFYGISVEEALRKAELPEDVFSHKTPVMKEEDYFKFMEAVGTLVVDRETLVKIACTNQIESFSPPIFSAYCSKNGRVCIERLARYKKLIGPMIFEVIRSNGNTEIKLTTENSKMELPQFLIETEFVFLVGIIRKATKEEIKPVIVKMKRRIGNDILANFFGVAITQADCNSITFCNIDLEKTFISYDESMWSYFEPELSRRLAELDVNDSISARVKSALIELLPGGGYTIEDVATKVGMSKRTLQRKLSKENTTFQKQLNNIREMLAIHYIRNTEMTTNDIAYLLGYKELNSFLRAFTKWTGVSITEYKKQIQQLQ